MKKLVLVAALSAVLLPPIATAQGDVKKVIAEGVGSTIEEARRAAIRAAVVTTVGEMVDAETLVENDNLVQDQILTYSNGYVDSMKVLSANTNAAGLVTLRISAEVRQTKLRQKVTEIMKTEAAADGDSLFAEMLSRKTSIEDAGKMLAKVLSDHREDLLLEAGVAMGEDGKPAVDLEPNSGKVTVTVQLSVNDKAWNAWVAEACDCFGKMSEKVEPNKGVGGGYWGERNYYKYNLFVRHNHNEHPFNKVIVGDKVFFFKNDYEQTLEQTIKEQLSAAPERPWVHIALVDKAGWTIAAEHVETYRFKQFPLFFYSLNYEDSKTRTSHIPVFKRTAPSVMDVGFDNLSLAELKAVSKIVCTIGPRLELQSSEAEKMLVYQKTHQNRTIMVGDVSFELAQLSPRLLMGTTEVTVGLWQEVMLSVASEPADPKLNLPVEVDEISKCLSFLQKLNTRPEIQKAGLVFRLPRGDEWETACLAGSTGDYCRLADGTEITEATLNEVAWYSGNSSGYADDSQHAQLVGLKKPNAFGLYDMLGNIAECTLAVRSDGERVFRGGNYYDSIDNCKSTSTRWPNYKGMGLRLCASLKED